MASHINYSLNTNENFVIFLTSMLIICVIDSFTSRMKYQSITYLLREVDINIGLWTLQVKCTQYEICGNVTFKNARPNFIFIFEVGQGKHHFLVKIIKF